MPNDPRAPLTEEQILSLPAGRELDAYIAFYLFGYRWFKRTREGMANQHILYPSEVSMRANYRPDWYQEVDYWPSGGDRFSDWYGGGGGIDVIGRWLPGFCSTYDGMGFVLTEMDTAHSYWCRISTPFRPGHPHSAGFTKHHVTGWNGLPNYSAGGNTMPHAVCKAALLALVIGPDVLPSYLTPERMRSNG